MNIAAVKSLVEATITSYKMSASLHSAAYWKWVPLKNVPY